MTINNFGLGKVDFSNFKNLFNGNTNNITNNQGADKIFANQDESEFISLNLNAKKAQEEYKELINTNKNTDSNDESLDTLKQKEQEYQDKIKEYEQKEEELTAQKEELEKKLANEQNKYNALEKQAQEENEYYKKIIDKINDASKDMETSVAKEQKAAVYQALSQYEKNGNGKEWSEYLADFMKGKSFGDDYVNLIKGLTNKADYTKLNLSNLGKQMTSSADTLSDTQSQLDTVSGELTNIKNLKTEANTNLQETQGKIKTAEEKIAQQKAESCAEDSSSKESSVFDSLSEAQKTVVTQKAAEIEAKLPDYITISSAWKEEIALVVENNIDLTEKLPDGKPRYIIAKGQKDCEYHIYDMEPTVVMNGTVSLCETIVRKYAPCGGYDTILYGNGDLSDFKEADNGTEYFYLDNCNEMRCGRACYCTDSPLSLDINGDGVKTSNDIIDYDIDGDGVVDKINDSADAVLVFDKDNDGISGSNGSEAFGNNTDLDGDGIADGYKDGFEALKALAKKENLVNGDDDNKLDSNDIKVLEEKYGFKIKANGYNSKAQSLSDLGISEINLAKTSNTTMQDDFDGNGNQLMTQEGATFKINGETREYADIWHKKQDTAEDKENKEEDNINNSFSGALSLNLNEVLNEINKTTSLSNEAINNASGVVKKNSKMSNNIFMEYLNKTSVQAENIKEEFEEQQEEKKKEEEKE